MQVQRSYIAAIHDIVMAAISFMVALYLRQGDAFSFHYPYVMESALLFTAIAGVVFISMRLYSGLWRYASVSDLLQLTKAVTLSLLIFTVVLFLFTRLEQFPRSTIVINWFVLLALLGGPRFLYRNIKDSLALKGKITNQEGGMQNIPVLLVGTDSHAELFLRQTKRNPNAIYHVVGIIDEDKKKKGASIHAVTILGNQEQLPHIIKKLKKQNKAPHRVVVSDEHSGAYIRKLLQRTEAVGLPLAKLPKLSDLKDGKEEVKVRPIAIEDLLGRPQRAPNLGRREELIQGKRILVTGAGGTIGSELVRQISNLSPASLTLYELSEFNLYQIEQQLREKFPHIACRGVIGDVRDVKRLDYIFSEEKPELVFHAAALKHVPIVEENVMEAVLTNVLGSKHVADMCLKHKAQKMVMISTDKAVHPSSLMGVTKRIAEYYVQGMGAAHPRMKTDFATVRFGNVLGSSGSVIPLFQKQLEAGGPMTVTHPEMTRYFMTVPEAVELVLQASTLSSKESGEKSSIYVLDMGEPIRIKDLAEQMIRLSGRENVKITYSGIRDGEKLYEELFYDYEEKAPTIYDDIQKACAKELDYDALVKQIEKLCALCEKHSESKVIGLLKEMVPEYSKPDHDQNTEDQGDLNDDAKRAHA